MSSVIDTTFASHGFALSVQHWMDLGRGDDELTGSPKNIEEAAIRITYLLVARILGMYHYFKDDGTLLDLATSTICRAVLDATATTKNTTTTTTAESSNYHHHDNSPLNLTTIEKVTSPSILLQLETFVTCMLYGYHNKENPFHNFQHAYHVVISANKFIESMLLSGNPDKPRHVFGLGSDPLLLMALIFSALIHDVGHTGVSNLQRAEDEPELSKQYYGDTSLHEHYSLHVAFTELGKEEYKELRALMFLEQDGEDNNNNNNNNNKGNRNYESFKDMVWEAVLSTDIASPARAEAAKVKYFEAFPSAGLDEEALDEDGPIAALRRSSMASNISMPRASHNDEKKTATTTKTNLNRRASGETVSSDITMDSYSMMKTQNKVSRNTGAVMSSSRRASNGSGGSGLQRRTISRRHSIETMTSQYSEFAADSICMTRVGSGSGSGGIARRASLTGGAPHQRRVTGSHGPESGLAGMAHARRASLGYVTTADGSTDHHYHHHQNRRGSPAQGLATSGHANRGKRHQQKRTNSLELVGAGVVGGTGEYDGDSSLSGSSGGGEFDGVVVTGKPSDLTDQDANALLNPPISSKADREQRRHVAQRRMSNGVPVKFGSIPQGHGITEENPGDSEVSGNLDNDTDVAYGDRSSRGGLEYVSEELRRQVVMELCLRAADVAHWYQSWDTMINFNRRIYKELCKASNKGRGFDPRPNWFDNQAKIMETYLLPLAEQIEYVGALRRGSGIDLVSNLESNNDLWLVRGFDVVEALKAEEEGA